MSCPLLNLPQDVLCAIPNSGTTIHECADMLKSCRVTCVQMRKICCLCAEILDARVQREVDTIMKRFPRWFAYSNSLHTVTVEEWIHHGMAMFRLEWHNQVQLAQTVHNDMMQMAQTAHHDIMQNLQEKEAAISKLLKVPDICHFVHPLNCYALFSKANNNSLCVEGASIVHLNLNSVIKWFYQYGWRLDTCSALLFSRACAARLDAGNSWMVLSEFTKFVSTCYQPLDEFQCHVMEKIGTVKEQELAGDMRTLYTVQWTSKVHNNFFMLHSESSRMLSSKSEISSYRRKFDMTALSQEALSLYAKLIREMRKNGGQPDTEMAVIHKLNACLPRSVLMRQSYPQALW